MSTANMAASLPYSISHAITQYPSEQYLSYHQYHPTPQDYYRMEYLKENDFMNTDIHNSIDEELLGAFEGTEYTPLAHLSWTDVEDMSQLPQSELMSERTELGSDGVDDSGSDYSDPGSCYSDTYDNTASIMSMKEDENSFYNESLYQPEELFQCSPLSQVFATDMPSHDPVRPPQKKKPGRKKGQTSKVLHLWEFIRDLLKDPKCNGNIIQWENKEEGVFRVVKSSEVATLWGQKKKNKKEMTYEKMSRSMRYSRKEGYFIDLPKNSGYPKKLCFRFGPKSTGWQ